MTIIDSQVHAYQANTPKRPWHSVPNWPDHVTGDEMVVAMNKVGVDGAIFISAFSLYRHGWPLPGRARCILQSGPSGDLPPSPGTPKSLGRRASNRASCKPREWTALGVSFLWRSNVEPELLRKRC
jgi:hypothetical protein